MKVILTHNNADCDAIASLLAMYKLEPEAIPVLPQHVNRNVAQFLLLYDRNWGMVAAEDVPRGEKVELAFVVDSQTFNMVRGMQPDTPVYIIDHHPQTRELPPHHIYTGDITGANATLMVEKLVERGQSVDSIEATLLLMGIYEDTGNLTYKSTTARDLQAAAWLLERGADLDVLRQFLQHNLNEAQTKLFQQLAASATTLNVNGHNIVLASTMVSEQVMESSIVAHELLSAFDCDALFMVIGVDDGNQIIARSVVDNVDVGALLRHFNGNGHGRAAAALARGETLETTLRRLTDLLPQYTTPAVRVEQLMSWGVQTVESHQTVAAAQAAMLETGHEGYPVLEDGKIVGLLTRRAVDRAMLHHLHKLTVAEIMEVGSHSVTINTSADLLKERMMATGWGQMPVVDENGKLIGIVTRTDLIKHWGQQPDTRYRQHEVLQQLQTMLSPGVWRLLQAIGAMATAQHKGLYMVGGIVRDILLGRPNLDIDLVVEGDAISLARALQQHYGGQVFQHGHFGTARWRLEPIVVERLGYIWEVGRYPESIDFATSRAEFYEAPTVLPTVRSGSIKLDLHRRDFSINALAIRLAPEPSGQLLDFYNGERDLEDGVIRVLHTLSFIDDPTRMLRAVRFEQRFGFTIEPRTVELIGKALPLLERVSGDRLRHEINVILAEENALQTLERLEQLGILPAIHPSLKLDDEVRRHYATLRQVRANPPWQLAEDFDNWRVIAFSLLLYRLDETEIESISRRLSLSREVTKHLLAVRTGYQWLDQAPRLSPSEFVAIYEKLGETAWLANWIMAEPPVRATLEKLATTWRYLKPHLKGNDLIAMGLPVGPAVGELLHELRDAWLDGKLESLEDEQNYARRRIETFTSQG